MRNPILERRIVPVTHPTESQKSVMSKIVAAATSQLAAADISGTPNLVAARDMLEKMGLIYLDDEGAHLTDQGNEVMINQNLVSPGGGLTDDGQEAAHGDEAEDAAPDMGDDELDMDMDFGDEEDDEGEFSFGGEDLEDEDGEKEDVDMKADEELHEPKESFSLIATIRENAARSKFQHVPEDFMDGLSMEEIQQLSAVIDGGAQIYKFGSLYQKAYEHFVSEMPYSTAKGRSGDPDEWLTHRLMSGDNPTSIDDETGAAEARWDASRGH